MLDNMNEYDLELFECTRLFSNRIKINSAGISPATQRREQKSRGMQWRKNIAPQVVDFGVKCSPGKEELEDESFYSCGTIVLKSSPASSSYHSDEIDLQLGSSHGSQIAQRNSNSSLGSASHGDSAGQSMHDSVFSSPTLDSENEIVELMGMESMDVESEPLQIDDLLFSDIKTETPDRKRSARKRLDMSVACENHPATPKSSTIASLITTPERVCLGNISNTILPLMRPALKRPDPPAPSSPFKAAKKLRCEEEMAIPIARAPMSLPCHLQQQHAKKPIFRKSVSVDEAAMLFDDKNKTADFCYELCLPILAKSKHSDLKSITPATMHRLLNGDYDHTVASYKVIDCRYPYEFEGGHIRGAKNLFMENQIYDEFMKLARTPHVNADGKRNIVIFHCEFSSERGPRQYRHLRNIDRAAHTYPTLQYPEIYLLEGGYKAFFEEHRECCEPQAYRLMVDPDYAAQYQDYRAKAKRSSSFVGGETGSKLMRVKSRSRLAL